MYKILIAEDESEMRNLLVKYINKKTDMEVIGSAVNGQEALDLARQTRPDIVITDIFMPVMNGLEFLTAATEEGLPLKAVIISGYDTFEYAKKAISLGVSDYLLKPFDPTELDHVLNKITEELKSQQMLRENMKMLKTQANENENVFKEKILRDLLVGKAVSENAGKWILEKDGYCCVCLLKFPVYMTSKEWNMEKRENVEELVLILKGNYLPEEVRIYGLSLQQNGIILVMAGEKISSQLFARKIRSGIEHLQASMQKYYNLRLICVIGEMYGSWKKLEDSYQSALNIWKRMVTTDKMLFICGQINDMAERKGDLEQDYSVQTRKLKEDILLAVKMGKEQEYLAGLEQLIALYATLAPGKIDFAALSAQEMFFALFEEIEKIELDTEEKISVEEMQRQFKNKTENASLIEIKEMLKKYFSVCVQIFQKSRGKQQKERIAENVKKLIENHLDFEDLTLEWIAEQLHFSPTYVRQIFRQETGEKVAEYIIRKRMEKAAKLLLKTDMKILDVARVCGYSNQRYFASSFKKYYECTPTDFKRMMEEQG